MTMSIITLLTDYGTDDTYVAEVKAGLLSGVPGVTLVDVTHHVPPGDVRAAHYLLARSWYRFPASTVHFVAVDPGVGTERRGLAAQVRGHRFVAPDNGLLAVLPDDTRFVALPIPPNVAPTFHGRDVFAPAAAHLARGASLESLGSAITDPYRAPLPAPRVEGGWVVGEVVHVDRFGNLVSNIGEPVPAGARVQVGDAAVGMLGHTFADVPPGGLIAYVGRGGTVEIGLRDGSATERLRLGVGATVRVAAH